MQIHCFIYVCLFISQAIVTFLQEKNILSFRLTLGLHKTHENSFFSIARYRVCSLQHTHPAQWKCMFVTD